MYDELKKENQSFNNEMKELNLKKGKITENANLITEIGGQVTVMSNKLLQSNLEISGILCSAKENCHKIAYDVCKKVNADLKSEDIVAAYRLGNMKDEEGKVKLHRPMLVKFNSIRVRNLVYKNKKVLKRSEGEADGPKVFINENLSKETRALLREVNIKRKEKEWGHLWTNFGMIYVRKNDSSKIIAIKAKEDLKFIN